MSYVNNNYGNAIPNPSRANNYISDPNKLVTINVTGPGRVVLQGGGISSDETFGGAWSVGTLGSVGTSVLQIGPYQTPNENWSETDQLLNALGFKTVNGQTYNGSGSVQGDPDIPNSVTVNSGGMFVVAVDQVNTNSLNVSGTPAYGANGTPNYLRNPIILNGGTLSATGSEVASFNYSTFAFSSNPVTAKLGGDFTVCAGTSTIDAYDPIGGTGARTVQLLGGSRLLRNSTAAFAAGTVLTYNTNWAGTLNVNGGGYGGWFDLMRDSGGSVSVAPGATINIMNGATVKECDLTTDVDSNGNAEEPSGAVADPYGGLYDTTSGNSVNITGGSGGGHLVFSRSTAMTYGGNISGGLNLAMEGDSGLLVLSSTNNTYTNGTDVEDGTLEALASDALPYGSALTVGATERSSWVILWEPRSTWSRHQCMPRRPQARWRRCRNRAHWRCWAWPESSQRQQLGGSGGLRTGKSMTVA